MPRPPRIGTITLRRDGWPPVEVYLDRRANGQIYLTFSCLHHDRLERVELDDQQVRRFHTFLHRWMPSMRELKEDYRRPDSHTTGSTAPAR